MVKIDSGPGFVVMVGGSSLAGLSIGGVIMYPFHGRPWAPWVWIGLSMVLSLVVLTVWDRRGR